MLKNTKGVTLIALAITIVVMLIILGITINTADDLIRESDETKFQTTMYLVKARAETLFDDYLFDGTDNLGESITDIEITDIGWEDDTSRYIYRQWDNDMLENQGIKYDDTFDGELFLIQYDITEEKVDIGCSIGFVDENGVAKYTLSSLEE